MEVITCHLGKRYALLVFSNKNKEFLSKLQDIGFKHFKQLGMDRGLSKEVTGVNNQSINKYWRDKNIQQKQQNIVLNNQNKDLLKTKDNLSNVISNNQNLISTLDTQLNDLQLKKIDLDIDLENTKKLRDSVKNDTNKSIEEKKRNYDEITKQQKQIRTLRQVYTNKEKSIRELKNNILL
jgi:predicted RNase H-like nuclease (RuvC/YqgF family)